MIDFIVRIKEVDRRYAAFVYKRENEANPEWDLRAAFEAMKND